MNAVRFGSLFQPFSTNGKGHVPAVALWEVDLAVKLLGAPPNGLRAVIRPRLLLGHPFWDRPQVSALTGLPLAGPKRSTEHELANDPGEVWVECL